MYATGNCGVMRPEKILKRLVNLDGGFLNAYNSYSSACSTYVSPYIYGDAAGGNSEADVLNAKLIILWGHNPSETIFGSLHNYYLAQAKAKGIPHRGHRPAHERYGAEPFRGVDPARPTTDGALCDAIAYTIIKMGLHDLAFLHKVLRRLRRGNAPRGRACRVELPQLPRRLAGRHCQGRCLGRADHGRSCLYDRQAGLSACYGEARHDHPWLRTAAPRKRRAGRRAALRRWPASRETSENPAAAPGPSEIRAPRPAIAFPVGEDAYPAISRPSSGQTRCSAPRRWTLHTTA